MISSVRKSEISIPHQTQCSTDQRSLLTNTAVLAANEAARDTLALHMLAIVVRGIAVIAGLHSERACVQRAVERLFLCGPELELACAIHVVAAEGDLWRTIWEHVKNLAIYLLHQRITVGAEVNARTGHRAHLVIFEHSRASLIASHVVAFFPIFHRFPSKREPHTRVIGLAN